MSDKSIDRKDDRLQQILDVGIALSAEKDPNKLLYLIIKTAMSLTNSDGGNLYILKDDELIFKVRRTISKNVHLGINGEKIDLPPVPLTKENICAYAALSKKALNIEDVYESDHFDFSGLKRYDTLIGYRTKSIVAIPMIDKDDEVIGVMELINAMDCDNNVRSYTDEEERILISLSSQTAICITNMDYLKEINDQMWSFTEAMTEAIDARTPYNANHTRKVAKYSALLIDHINELYEKKEESHYFSKERKDEVILAALLHDIGKMVVPIEVMNKTSRLENHRRELEDRLEKINLMVRVDELENTISSKEADLLRSRIAECRELVDKVDSSGCLDEKMLEGIFRILDYSYKDISFLSEEEKECLMIPRGTLTESERRIMEGHVEMTERILSKVHFNRAHRNVPKWASEHHEFINGKGYPRGLKEDELDIESRILAVADITDALLAKDRPYKEPLPKDKAFAIMEDMARNGMIDEKLVSYMKECLNHSN